MDPMRCFGILAGGKGERIGGDKPYKIFRGRPLILWVYSAMAPFNLKTYISIRKKDEERRLLELFISYGFPTESLEIVQDIVSFEGPLAGIYSLLSFMKEKEIVIATCDQPLIKTEHLLRLFEAEKGISFFEVAGRIEPFPIRLSKEALTHLEEYVKLSQGKSVLGFIDFLANKTELFKIEICHDDEGLFQSVNTQQDLERLNDVQL